MDQNILSILQNLSENMHCPGCGKKYSIGEVKFIGQQGGQFMLQLACEGCKVPVWVNFVDGKGKIEQETNLIDLSPITSDEMIDFHKELKVFDGNFRKLFKA